MLGRVGPPPSQTAAVPSATAIAAAFGLGTPIGALDPVDRAWSHAVYRLDTDRGSYAVKVLRDPWDDERWQQRLEVAWAFELTAYDAGVAMPQPIPEPHDVGCLAWVEVAAGDPVPTRVHRWVTGRQAPLRPVAIEVARWAGTTLAALHALAVVPAPESSTSADDPVVQRWEQLIESARRLGAPWADELEAVHASVATVAELAAASPAGAGRVMSHGDVDQKNLLLGPAGPVLCDWDVAAGVVPRRELADVALSMAGWSEEEIGRQVVASYRERHALDGVIEPSDLGPSLLSSVDWLALNVERALGLRGDVAALGARLVPELLAELPLHVAVALRVTDFLRG